MYITEVYGIVLQKAINFEVHIQSDISGYTLYVADLGAGRGFVVTGNTFDELISNIMSKINLWKTIIYDTDQRLKVDIRRGLGEVNGEA